MSSQPKTFLTPEEYLEIERQSDVRHEYYNGEMFLMAGGSSQHGVIPHTTQGLSRKRS
jgi:Uma2 family endonuclease